MSKEMRGRMIFAKYKIIIRFFVKCVSIFPMRMRIRLLEMNRNVRGKKGIGIRYVLIKAIACSCGDNVAVFPGVYLLNPQNLVIGNNVSIHPMCYLDCGHEMKKSIIIEDNVSLAHGITIMATTHLYTRGDIPIRDQGADTKPVHIQNNVWIGAKATILYGVTIASGCVIGANAVVTKSTQPDKVYAGIPAKVIKERVLAVE